MPNHYIVSTFEEFVVFTFLWIPLAFAAYVIGRRDISPKALLIFLVIESIALIRFGESLNHAMDTLREFVVLSFLWLPPVFAAYAIGRRRISLRMILLFFAVESIALAHFAVILRRVLAEDL